MKISKLSRRLAALTLAASLFTIGLPLSAGAASFTDVPSDAWYHDYVYELVDKGVLTGSSATTFSPNATLTRAAFVTMLARSYLTAAESDAYRFKGSFKDVPESHWGNRYINWARENGVVSGTTSDTFAPDRAVTRQEMAVIVTNFARAVGRKMPSVKEAAAFTDSGDISNFAKAAVTVCQQAGVLSGYKDGSFRPKGSALRSEAASLTANFLKNCLPSTQYNILRKRISSTAVRAVEFDPSQFTADLIMGRDVADGSEAPASMVQRSGAKIAVNVAFFDMRNYQALGTLIKQSRVVTTFETYAPDKSALTLDPDGRFSIRNFSTKHSAVLHKKAEDPEPEEQESNPSEPEEEGEDAAETPEEEPSVSAIIVNRWPSSETDAARILFTRDWGHDLAFPAKDAVTLSADGTILSVDHDKNVEIPEGGYVLAQRARRQYEGNFFDSCEVGDTIEIQRTYEGLDNMQPVLSIGAGPRILRNGQVYGSQSTYRSEGFTDPNITSYDALRVAGGIKPDGRLVLLTCYANLDRLARILLSMGCTDAINFDGGGSANLYVDGFWLRGPQDRRLNNMLVFKDK